MGEDVARLSASPEPVEPVIDLTTDGDDDERPQTGGRRARRPNSLVPGKIVPSPKTEDTVLKPLHYPPVDVEVQNYWVYFFYRFCAERHHMYDRRQSGVARNKLSADYTMTNTHIGNVYRQLDGGSQRMRTSIIPNGDQSAEEVCFRVLLYCAFYNEDSWEALGAAATGGVPSWKTFKQDLPAMEAALHDLSVVQKRKIYLGGFQLVPPTIYFCDDRNKSKSIANYAASLWLVEAMMEAGLPAELVRCKYAVDASYVLQTIPTLGGFLSLNILCFLNDSTHFTWLYRDFATCGPGSRKFLQRMFGESTINNEAMEAAGLQWLYDHQWRYYARLGIDPPHEWETGLRPGMRVLDIENALCWAHRYVAAYQKSGRKSIADEPNPKFDPIVDLETSAPAWCDPEAHVRSSSQPLWVDAELDARLKSLGDEVYEVERVVAQNGSRYRVRWLGYPPEDDTWEPEASLREDAHDALMEWKSWDDRVWTAIERIKKQRGSSTKREDDNDKPTAASPSRRDRKERASDGDDIKPRKRFKEDDDNIEPPTQRRRAKQPRRETVVVDDDDDEKPPRSKRRPARPSAVVHGSRHHPIKIE
ncbi:hypothetical protein Q8F55_001929 [Vanrija albida]|uniref:Chromo domain-containing protein n=1 Tax=Vanrija albida TaxID=181172 RepID=A0ABR3Q971_9TREE